MVEPRPQSDQPPVLGSPAQGVFVGRQREMGELKAALEDALSGQGRLVMLVGEPGIGKTRTSQELAAYATLRGARVLWGRCYEGQGAPPYWPWVQLIRSYIRERDPDQLRSQMGAGAADIAEVVPELREPLPDLEPPPALEPQQARFRLFDSFAAFLTRASQAQPLMVVLDNLHWADRPSLLLLEFLAQELAEGRLLVVGTYRDSELTRRHPLARTLGELAREPLFRRVPLRGLSKEEVGDFIKAASGFTPPRDLVRAVYAQTEGNPLFMAEVVRLLAQEGDLTAGPLTSSGRAGEGQSWSILIPAGVREVIGRHLDRLSEGCNQVLTVASVVGREFDLPLLEKLMGDPSTRRGNSQAASTGGGLSGDELLEAVEEALAARLIEELPSAVGRYQFAHVLIQDTLAQELPAARRARLHRRIAEALEELYGTRVEAHAAELAYHFAQAEPVLGTEKLVRYSLLAGEQALASYAWEQALDHFQRALVAKEVPLTSTEPANDAESAALLFGLGRAQEATREAFQVQDVVSNLKRALDYYANAGDVAQAVAVAEYPIGAALGVATGAGELISRALALVAPDSYQAGRLLSTYGLTLYQDTGDYGGAQEAFARALAVAQRAKDAALEMRTLTNAANVHFYHLRPQQVLEKGLRAIELARRGGDPRTEALAGSHIVRALDVMGDLEGARRHALATLAAAERLRDRYLLAQALWLNGGLSYRDGNRQDARAFLDRSLALAPHDPRLFCTRTALEYEAGDFGQGAAYMERLLDATHRSGMGTALA